MARVRNRAAAAPADTRHPDLIRGDFNRDGSWNFSREVRSARWRFVDSLVAARRNHGEMSPREFAMRMVSLPQWPQFEEMFKAADLEQWLDLHRPIDWAGAQVTTSSASAVKYCGRGAYGKWDHGLFVPEDEQIDETPHVGASGEVDAMAKRLAERYGTATQEPDFKKRLSELRDQGDSIVSGKQALLVMTPEERAAKIALLRSKGWGGEKAAGRTASSESESGATPTSGEDAIGLPGASLEVSLFPEPDGEVAT